MDRHTNTRFKTMIRQMEQMYRLDHLFASNPRRRFKLCQMAAMLGVTERTVERLLDVMFKFGAPIDTSKRPIGDQGIGTRYGRSKKGWRLDFGYPAISKLTARLRMLEDRGPMMSIARQQKKLSSVLTKNK
jgi:predicted DNA-binding transcriptional regulator YafY